MHTTGTPLASTRPSRLVRIGFVVATLVAWTAAPSVPTSAASRAAAAPSVMQTWRPIPPQPGAGATWLERINWWRSLGAGIDGSTFPAAGNQPGDNVGPQNHMDYLAGIRAKGSTYCGHGEDGAFPKVVGVSYSHNVLFCGVTDIGAAVNGWMNTPFHAPPLLAPTVTRVGAGSSTSGSAAVSAATSPISTTYLWPADGGVLPRTEMGIGESPDPKAMCPIIGKNPGQPFYAFFPSTRTFVSASIAVGETQVPFCMFKDAWSPLAVAGSQAASFTFFPKQPFVVGDVVTASISTTATNGSDPRTTTWTFRVATTPSVPTTEATGLPGAVSVVVRDGAGTGGLPITGRHLKVTQRTDQNIVVADLDVAADRPAVVPLAPGDYTTCLTVRNDMGWSDCGRGYVTVTAPVLPDVRPDAGFLAVDPVRLLDTRSAGAAFGRVQPGTTAVLDLGGRMPADATAVAINIAAVDPAADGWVRAYPCAGAVPVTSSLNPERGRVTVTGSIVPIGDGRICFQTWAATDLVIDLNGWLTRSATAGLVLGDQKRVLDTRAPASSIRRLAAGQTIEVQLVPAGSATTAVALNITAVDPGADGYVTVWPCGGDRPLVSNLNPIAGVTRPNLANVRVSSAGTVCLFTLRETDLVVDLLARYDTGAPTRYAAIDPVRVVDTRVRPFAYTADMLTPRITLGDVVAVQATLTATDTFEAGYLSAYACANGPWPGTANVNFAARATSGNAALMPVSAGFTCLRRLSMFGQVVVDVAGFWDVP